MHKADTSPQIQKVYDEKIGRLSEEERFSRGLSLTHFCREICFAGIQEREPSLKGPGLRARFFEAIYGAGFSSTERKKIMATLTSSPSPPSSPSR